MTIDTHTTGTASIVLVLALVSTQSGHAQENASDEGLLEVNVHAGLFIPGDPGLGERPEFNGGVRLTYGLPGSFALGGNLDWVRDRSQFRLAESPVFTSFVDNMFLYSAEIDYTAWGSDRLRYFLGVGVGGATLRKSFDDGGDASQTFLLVPLTTGVKWFNRPVDPSFAFRIDLRDNMIWQGTLGERDRRLGLISRDSRTDHVELSAGVSLLFGR